MFVAIIQARMGATRLPGKVLLDLEGTTVLEHVINRVKASKLVDLVVVATTVDKKDLKIAALCAELGVSVYCGSEADVLDRYYQAAKLFKAENVVRITADCPVMDPQVIDEVLALHLRTKADYTSNTLKETYPDGQDVEVFTFEALKYAWKHARLASEREHVTPFVRKHSELFTYATLEYKEDLSNKRWTLDNAEDFEFLKQVYKHLYLKNNLFGMDDLLALVKEKPDIEMINQHIVRNAGFKKSLKEDKLLEIDDTEV